MKSLQVLLSWLCVACVLGLGDSYILRHTRVGNDFTLTCEVENSSTVPDFWINSTEIVDIPKASQLTSVTKFVLVPQHEGTFYCGERDGEMISNGVGPFAANPNFYSPNKASPDDSRIDNLGDNETLLCPIQLGVELRITSTLLSSLTIIGIEEENIGSYVCTLTVINPYDNEVWSISRVLTLRSYESPLQLHRNIVASAAVGAVAIIICLIILSCLCPVIRRRTTTGTCASNNQENSQESPSNPPRYQKKYQRIQRTTSMQSLESLFRGEFNHKYLSKNPISIGSGAFGTVFELQYKGCPVAMKLLKNHAQEYLSGYNCTEGNIQDEALKAFVNECELLQKLDHKNVVRHFHTCTDPKSNLPMLIMELMERSLKEYLKHQVQKCTMLSITCQMSLCLDIAEGLKYLHSKEIMHRDLCDDNVLLLATDNVPTAKIADFGMSRLLPGDFVSKTLSGLAHRQAYFPREVREDPRHYSFKIDVYSFGVVATQIATVTTPIKKNEDTTRLIEDMPDCHQLKNVILKCLCEDRKTRLDSTGLVDHIKVSLGETH